MKKELFSLAAGLMLTTIVSCSKGEEGLGTESCPRSPDQEFTLNIGSSSEEGAFTGKAQFDLEILFSTPNIIGKIDLERVAATFHPGASQDLKSAVLEKEIDCNIRVLTWYKSIQEDKDFAIPFENMDQFLVFWDGLAFLLLSQDDQNVLLSDFKTGYNNSQIVFYPNIFYPEESPPSFDFTFSTINLGEVEISTADTTSSGFKPNTETYSFFSEVTKQIAKLSYIGALGKNTQSVNSYLRFMVKIGIKHPLINES